MSKTQYPAYGKEVTDPHLPSISRDSPFKKGCPIVQKKREILYNPPFHSGKNHG